MLPTEANIQSVVNNEDGWSVLVTYTDQNGAEYSTNFPYAGAPDQIDVTAEDNYTYYESLITG